MHCLRSTRTVKRFASEIERQGKIIDQRLHAHALWRISVTSSWWGVSTPSSTILLPVGPGESTLLVQSDRIGGHAVFFLPSLPRTTKPESCWWSICFLPVLNQDCNIRSSILWYRSLFGMDGDRIAFASLVATLDSDPLIDEILRRFVRWWRTRMKTSPKLA